MALRIPSSQEHINKKLAVEPKLTQIPIYILRKHGNISKGVFAYILQKTKAYHEHCNFKHLINSIWDTVKYLNYSFVLTSVVK